MPSDAVFQAGELIGGRYRLRQLVGVGGMGAVWRVHNEATDRDVAIKFMLPELAKTPAQLQRFFQEAKALGRVRHRSIVEVYDLGRIERLEGAPAEPRAGTPYLVMELLDGEPLDAILRRLRRLPLRAALELGAAISRGLQAAHASWIVHRDLKPANIFLHRERDGSIVPKILDFGVSKLLSPSLGRVVTSSGVVVGSPGYMSPEQAAGDVDIDARSDVWSLGVILYHCLTGRQPFREQNYNATMLAIVMTEPPTLESLVEVPPAVSAIVRQCLQKRRDDRFASAESLLAALEAALALLPAGEGLESLARTSASESAEPDHSTHTVAHDTEVRAPSFTAVYNGAPGELPKTVEMAAPPRPRRVPRTPIAVAVVVLAFVVALAVWPRGSSPAAPTAIGSTSVNASTAPAPSSPSPVSTTPVALGSVAAPAPSPPLKKLSKAVTPKAAKPATTGKQSEGVLDPGLP